MADRRPRFVLFVGPIATGKTTLRRKQCVDGFIHIDATEIFVRLSGGGDGPFPGPFEAEIEKLGTGMARQALRESRDVTTEILGDNLAGTQLLTSGLASLGYEVEVVALTCDVDEALARHNRACETDPTYVSAYFTQSFHYKWLLAAIGEEAQKAGGS